MKRSGWLARTLRQLTAAQRARRERPFGIFTDLDGTLIAPGGQPYTDAIVALAASRDWPLVAMTGRDSARVLAEIDRGELPRFSAVICAVGTEIWLLQAGGGYRPDGGYRRRLAHIYDKPAALAIVQQIVRASDPALQLHIQHKSEPEPFKLSLQFSAAAASDIAAAAAPFKQNLPRSKIILSEDIFQPGRHNIDIVPAGKADAVSHLMQTYGIEQGIAAGDSENDRDALEIPELTAVWIENHAGPVALLRQLQANK